MLKHSKLLIRRSAISRDGFSGLKFTQQEAVQADEEFLAGDAAPARLSACFQKALEPESQ